MTLQALDKLVYTAKVAAFGLSFKPHSDDIRDSPSLDLAVSGRPCSCERPSSSTLETISTQPLGVPRNGHTWGWGDRDR
jgi:hypothetical protein